jgi:NADPH2:quinone reductase
VNACKALVCDALGPAAGLRIAEVEEPVARDGEAIVEVAFVALNFFDTLIIAGKYQTKPELPFSPGGEFSGRVVALGPGVEGLSLGQRVFGAIPYGAARSRIAVAAARLTPVPEGLSLERAAGLSIAYGTTMHAFVQRANLQAGETLVVLGASGGVGLAAVEIGALMGARVIACASSAQKVAHALKHGAGEGIDYGSADLRAELKRIAPDGVDVVYDPVGGALTEAALRALRWKGRLLVVGFASGEIPRPPLNLALVKGCDILGVEWAKFAAIAPEQDRVNMSRVCHWAALDKLATYIHSRHELADFQAAFAELAERRAMGKTLLAIEELFMRQH